MVAGGLAVLWGFFWFGLIDLLVVLDQDERFHEHYLVESGWGLLYLVLVTTPLVVLCVRPGRRDAVEQLWVCAAAVVVGAVWGWALAAAAERARARRIGLAGGPAGGDVAPVWRRPDPALLGLGVVALVGAVAYGHPLARNTTLVEDITNGVSHFPMQASLGLAVAGLAILARVRTGSRLAAWTTAFTAAWLGVESVRLPRPGRQPRRPGRLGRGGVGRLLGGRWPSGQRRPPRATTRLGAPWVSRSPRACSPPTSPAWPTRPRGSPTPTGCTST